MDVRDANCMGKKNLPEGYVLTGTGDMQNFTETNTEVLFRNLEEELHTLISRYSMHTSDLKQLFLVYNEMY